MHRTPLIAAAALLCAAAPVVGSQIAETTAQTPRSAPWRAGVLPAPLAEAGGRERYVSKRGSDRWPGSRTRPWRSIDHALESARPGDRILVRGGVYRGVRGAGPRTSSVGPAVVASPKGRPNAPISIRPYPGERAVIGAFVSLPSARWFRLSGFVIDGARAPRGAQGVSLGNTDGAAPAHVELSYNEIRHFAPSDAHAHGILHSSGTDTALVGNRIHHIGRQRFYDHGIYLSGGRRVVVANNVIADITGGYGLHVWGDFDDAWVINNTVYNSAASGFTLGGNSERGRPDRVVTANNIFAGHRGSDHAQGYAAREFQPGSGNSLRRNLSWANARSAPWEIDVIPQVDDRTANPRFADPRRRDFRLRDGSVAIDSGEDFGLLVDAAGRPRDGEPDRGAYEAP
jgi:Right handed beta helix region